MHKRFKSFGKSSVSIALAIMLVISTMVMGFAEDVNVESKSTQTAKNSSVELYKGEGTIVLEGDSTTEENDNALTESASKKEDDAATNDEKNDQAVSGKASSKVTKALPQASGGTDPAVASGYARIYFANNIVTNWSSPEIYLYSGSNNNSWNDNGTLTKSNQYDGLYYKDLTTETNGSISGKFIVHGSEKGNGCTQSVDMTTDDIQAGKVFVPIRTRTADKRCYYEWVNLDSSYCHRFYYDNSVTHWTSVYAYCDGTSGNNNWPGVQMNSDGDRWYVNVYGDTTILNKQLNNCLIFNNNSGSQTVDINDSVSNVDKIWKKTGDSSGKATGSWSAISSSSAPFHFIYGNNNDPATFTNELTVQSDSNGYYVELPTTSGINYYFGISSSTSYTNLYVQGNNAGTITVTGDSNVNVESQISYSRDNTTFYCSRISTKSSTVEKVKIYINQSYGHSYTVSSELVSSAELGDTVTLLAKTGTIRDSGVGSTDLSNNKSYDKYSKMATFSSLKYADTNTAISYTQPPKYYYSNLYNSNDYTGYRLAVAENVQRNREIEYTVQIRDNFKTQYYVKAFNVNGKTYNIIDQSDADTTNGLYSCRFTVSSTDVGPIEITPIYYYIVGDGDEDKYITFSAEDFIGDVQKLWGSTIACYAYYSDGKDVTHINSNSNKFNALGGYPGQPMVYINGSYYMQIPKTLGENGGKDRIIEGITLNNYVWDDVHGRKSLGYSYNYDYNNNFESIQKINCQTYDYDDFVALRDTRAPSRIIFSFKYRSYNSNDNKTDEPLIGNVPPTNASNSDLSFVTNGGNDWDALVDYYDVPVDLFARRIANTTARTSSSNGTLTAEDEYLNETYVESSACTDKVYVVSDGYVAYYSHADNENQTKNYLGQYATRWYVYTKSGNNYQYVGALPPSAFLTGLVNQNLLAKEYDSTKTDYTSTNFLNYAQAATKASDNAFVTWEDYEAIYKACAGKPVVISYESNIFADGVDSGTGTGTTTNAYNNPYYAGTSQQPGYRCDGRWYYSKPNQKITGQTKIWVIKKDNDGNIVTDSNGYISYWEDQYVENSAVGTYTGATAAFINDLVDINGESMNGKTATTLYESEDGDFRFKADATSIGSEQNGSDNSTNYRFVGWYIETGSGLLNPITENVIGERQMDSFANFVAVYEAFPTATKTLVVDHSLYSDLYKGLSSTDGITAPGNGTGTPYIESVTIKSADGNTTYYNNGNRVSGARIITSDEFVLPTGVTSVPNDAVITVVLSSAYDSTNTNYTGVYVPKTTSGYIKNGTTDTNASTFTNNISTNSKVTYTYTYGTLFGSSNFARLSHYSDFTSTVIPIRFKYYDRKKSSVSLPETIDENPTTVTVNQVVTNGDIKAAIQAAFGAPSNTTETIEGQSVTTNSPVSSIGNVLDNYYFWFTQSEAVANVKTMTDYRKYNGDENGKYSINNYGEYGDTYQDTVLQNHFDCYGMPKLDSYTGGYTAPAGFVAENWVTYTKNDGTVHPYNGEQDLELSEIECVTVWGYNEPKTYNVMLHTPNSSVGSAEELINVTTLSSGIYLVDADNSTVANISAFYNQRLGGEDTLNAGANQPSDYLSKYGFATYFGSNGEITAPEKYEYAATEGENVGKSLVFDGWYDSTTGTKVSSDRTYGYRVTRDMALVAGYKLETATIVNDPHVSVENNGVQYFLDSNNVQRVRLMTVLNVFGNLDTRQTINGEENPEYGNQINSDENIKQVSAIYVQLPTKDSYGNKITWDSNAINALGLDNHETEGTVGYEVAQYLASESFTDNTLVSGSGKITVTINEINYSKNIITYTYSVTFDSDDIDKSTTMLTNKNRLTFTLPMRADYYDGTDATTPGSNSAIIAYAAINYEGKGWILSDNHAEFIADVSK